MNIDNIPALVRAVADMAESLSGIDTGDVFGHMTCTELDSVAMVLAVAGHIDAAAFIIGEHAGADEDVNDDMHTGLNEDDMAARGYAFSLAEI